LVELPVTSATVFLKIKLVSEPKEGQVMDKDRVKGAVNDAAGRAKRQVGEWTGDSETQAEGAAQQVKGKVQNAWGKTKDAVRNATDKTTHPHEQEDDRDLDRDQRKKDVA
jgi:uncharacterized protein YjbJ (UPF0337 family)